MSVLCAGLFVFVFAVFVALETLLFVQSQYRYGLDQRLCQCERLPGSSEFSSVVNATALVNGENLRWVAHLVTNYYYEPFNVINPYWMLLASHCFLTSANDYRKIYNGSFFISGGLNHSILNTYRSKRHFKKVKRIVLHAKFNPDDEQVDGPANDDIGLVELEEPFELGDQVLPSCLLDWGKSEFEGDLILSGFGRSLPDREPEFEYRDKERNTLIVARNRLKMLYLKQRHCPYDRAICMTNERDSVPYTGDSGAPLMYPSGSKLFVIGVMSKGEYREKNQTLTRLYATAIPKYLDWIDSHVQYSRCISGGKVFRFSWSKLVLFILALCLTCLVTACAVYALNPALFEMLRRSLKLSLGLLLNLPKRQADLSVGDASCK